MVKKKLFIFDFDGTIADTKALYYKALFTELKGSGHSPREIEKVIDFGISLEGVLRNLGLSFLTSWILHRRILRNIKKQAKNIKKCKDVDSIRNIKSDKILISNSLKEFILPIVRHFKLKKEFKGIYGCENFSDKPSFIREYMKKHKIKQENCYYIGDRAADVRVAREAGCKSIIIYGKCAWNSKKEIVKAHPDFILSSIRELKKIC